MTIKVITQNTSERNEETRQLFQDCQPHMDKGMGLAEAVKTVRNLPPNSNIYGLRWFKELRKYAAKQGYKGKR